MLKKQMWKNMFLFAVFLTHLREQYQTNKGEVFSVKPKWILSALYFLLGLHSHLRSFSLFGKE